MSDAVITMTGNATQLMAEYDKLNAKTAKMESELQRVKKASREAGEAAGKMSAGAKKALDDSTTAAEKYRTTLTSLRSALDSGTISEEKYKRARAAAQATYKEATKDVKALADAERAEAKAKQHAADVTNANKTAQDRYIENVRAAKKALDQGRISQETYNRELTRQQAMLKETPSSFGTWVGSIATVAVAYGAVTRVMQSVIAHQQDILNQAAEIGKRFDDNARKWQVLSGQNQLQSAESQKSILGVAMRVGTTSDEAQQAANQLVSAGFSPKDAAGGALESVLMAQRATGGEAPTEELARGMASFLASQGLAKNSQNMQMMAVGLTGVANATQMKLSQFPDFAKEAAAFKGKLSIPEQIAASAALQDIGMGGSESGTALRQLVIRGGTADTDKKKSALRKLGLKESDIDFSGENLDTVLGRLSGGFGKVKAEDRDNILKTLFEEQSIPAITAMMQDREKIKGLQGEFGNVAGFNASVERGTGGVTAAQNRLKLKGELSKLGKFGTDESVRQEQLKNVTDNMLTGGMARPAASAADAVASSFTSDSATRDFIQNTVLKMFGNTVGTFGRNAQGEREAATSGLKEAIDRNTEALLRQNAPQAPQAPLIAPTGGNPVFEHPGAR